ncbi:MAG TPA: metallophosphoesterase [Polyangia bacterium]|nr:metallophosphoesterase [Polyangia bacterium]
MVGRFLTFIVVAFTLLAGIHYYLWRRLVRDPAWRPPWQLVGGAVVTALAASIVLSLILGRGQGDVRKALAWPGYVWLGVMFLFLVTFAAVDLIRSAAFLARRAVGGEAPGSERRLFLARVAAAGATSLVAAASAIALRSANRRPPVRPITIRLPRLPPEQHGFSIVQITDMHVGPLLGREFVQDVVDRTNALAPDLIAITGDLVDGGVADLGHLIAPLAELRASHGVFFVTGNHEYFSGADQWVNELTRIGIRVLQNERVSIGNGSASFDLAGVDDPSAVHYGGLAPREAVRRALDGRDPDRELVLLAHQPRSALDAESFGVGLQLSGHTHGGQIWPFGLLIMLQQPFTAGLYRHQGSQVYVSRGTGFWGPPMRLGSPSEITHIRLEAERRA